MSYALNEIAALAKRATRGAGFSWGIAEEAAMATCWLAAFDLDGAAVLAGLLAQDSGAAWAEINPDSFDSNWTNAAQYLSPLACGPALSDNAARLKAGESITMENVTHSLFLLPFAALAARQINSPVSLGWEGVHLVTDGLAFSSTKPLDALKTTTSTTAPTRITCKLATALDNPIKPKFRGDITKETYARLITFATQSFAPITDTSRAHGAGSDAGLSDND